MNRRLLLAFASAALCSTLAFAADHAPPAVEFQKDIVYGKGGDQDLKLDLALPTNAGPPHPCLLFIHGGGWSGGDKSGHDNAAKAAAARGYVAASANYRLMPTARFPAQIEDVKCAVRFLRANAAKYNIDPNRIGAIGDSAGGHLVMMLGVTTDADGLEGTGGSPGVSSAVQAVVSYYGPGDLAAPDVPAAGQAIIAQFLGGPREEKSDDCKKASPITYLHPGEPPMLLLQGTKDPLVPYTQAVRMADAMTKANVPGRVELLNNAGHGFAGADAKHAAEASFAFFDEQLHPGK